MLIYTGLSAPQPLEHDVFPFQLQRENITSVSLFLVIGVYEQREKSGTKGSHGICAEMGLSAAHPNLSVIQSQM